jgi:hypothetical protein
MTRCAAARARGDRATCSRVAVEVAGRVRVATSGPDAMANNRWFGWAGHPALPRPASAHRPVVVVL